MKNIAFFCLNTKNKYSGGRIHAWTMAEAAAALGHNVTFYTNRIPVFYKDFKEFPNHLDINICLSKFFLFVPRRKYDLIIIIPHLSSQKSKVFDRIIYYPLIRLFKVLSIAKTIFLDFESPNWINEVLPNIRPYSVYANSNRIIPFTDVVLSTTKIGSVYAKNYYEKLNPNLQFEQLYLGINSIVADLIESPPKDNSIVFFGRFNEKHKNSGVVVNILKSIPPNFTLIIIGSKESIPQELLKRMIKTVKELNVFILFKNCISDYEKFSTLAKAKLLIYSSSFEGYGLPPLEAQYVGTPVLCSDIPVLREVNVKAEFIDFQDNEILKININRLLNNPPSALSLKGEVKSFASFENYCINLNKILN